MAATDIYPRPVLENLGDLLQGKQNHIDLREQEKATELQGEIDEIISEHPGILKHFTDTKLRSLISGN